MALLQRSLGWQGKAAAPGALSRAQHSLLPRAAGCPTAAKEDTGEQIRAISTALAACKGWTMTVCRPKVIEGSVAPHCTSQSLWHRQPLSSDRCQNMLLMLQPQASFLWDSHKDPYTASPPLQEASCTGHVFTLLNLKQNSNTSTIANTPLTAIQHSLLQRNETCGTRLPVSPVHWLSAWPHHQHMQKSSDQVRVSAPGGTQIPSGMTQLDVLVWHLHMAPEAEEVLPVSEHPDPWFPLPTLHLPCRASELWEGITAMGYSTAEGEKQQHWRWTIFTETTVWGTRHFCQLQLAHNHLNLRAEHLSCSCIPSMLLPAVGTKTWEQNMAARKKLFWNIQAHVLSWFHKINRGVRLTHPMQQQNLSPRAQDGSALNLSCQQHTLACWLPTEWLCNLKPP